MKSTETQLVMKSMLETRAHVLPSTIRKRSGLSFRRHRHGQNFLNPSVALPGGEVKGYGRLCISRTFNPCFRGKANFPHQPSHCVIS